MDLDLEPVRTRGRPRKGTSCEIVRELNEADIHLLESVPRGVQTSSIKRIRDAHHGIARLIATGLPQHQIAGITGYSQSRISILKGDPAFEELVEHYRRIALDASESIVADTSIKLATLTDAVVDEMLERVESEPEKLSISDLNDLGKFAADRSGFGPASKSTNVNISVGIADGLAARRRRTSGLGGMSAPAPLPSGEPTSAVRLAPPSVIEGEVVK